MESSESVRASPANNEPPAGPDSTLVQSPAGRPVDEPGLTNAALYHHFKSHADLFEALYLQLDQDPTLPVRAAPAASADDPQRHPAAAPAPFFEASAPPASPPVLPHDAPVVPPHPHRDLDPALRLPRFFPPEVNPLRPIFPRGPPDVPASLLPRPA